jgi:hypothetical protein
MSLSRIDVYMYMNQGKTTERFQKLITEYQDMESKLHLVRWANKEGDSDYFKLAFQDYDIRYNDYDLILQTLVFIEHKERTDWHRKALRYIYNQCGAVIDAAAVMKTVKDSEYTEKEKIGMMLELSVYGEAYVMLDDLDWKYGIL